MFLAGSKKVNPKEKVILYTKMAAHYMVILSMGGLTERSDYSPTKINCWVLAFISKAYPMDHFGFIPIIRSNFHRFVLIWVHP